MVYGKWINGYGRQFMVCGTWFIRIWYMINGIWDKWGSWYGSKKIAWFRMPQKDCMKNLWRHSVCSCVGESAKMILRGYSFNSLWCMWNGWMDLGDTLWYVGHGLGDYGTWYMGYWTSEVVGMVLRRLHDFACHKKMAWKNCDVTVFVLFVGESAEIILNGYSFNSLW